MAVRSRLHHTKIEEFAVWAIAQGFQRLPTKGDYEVLRLKKDGRDPVIMYKRLSTDHVSTFGYGSVLVNRWLAEKKQLRGKKCAGCGKPGGPLGLCDKCEAEILCDLCEKPLSGSWEEHHPDKFVHTKCKEGSNAAETAA